MTMNVTISRKVTAECGYPVAFDGDEPPLSLEERPLCDTRLIGGLVKTTSALSRGWLYDMERQSTFNLNLRREGKERQGT